jgi:hypothetical protein
MNVIIVKEGTMLYELNKRMQVFLRDGRSNET